MWELIAALVAVISSITGPATATEPAVRLNPPTTTIASPPTCAETEAMVNSLAYEFMNLEPARANFRAVASHCMGWTPDQVARWEAFIVDDVIAKESGGCWNVFRKGLWNGHGCDFRYPNGSGSDAGFFQLIGVWHGPSGYLCVNFGTCGKHAVTASPFTSMISGLRAIEHDGARPWCFSDWARSYHPKCATVPRHFG